MIITVCLLMLFLLGFIGFALDLSRLFIVKSELQTALDSCALAAAQELDGTSTATARALYAGPTVGNLNNVNLQSANWDGTGKLTSDSVILLNSELGVTSDGVAARYAVCRHVQPSVRLWLLQAMGVFSDRPDAFPATQNVAARAIATLGPAQSICALPLLLTPKTPSDTAPPWGYAIGDWIQLLSSPGSTTNGFIGWANLDGSTSARNTADQLDDANCDVSAGDDVLESGDIGTPGVQAAVADEWNERFGIYFGNRGVSQSNPVDRTGHAYTSASWPLGRGAYADFEQKRQNFTPYSGQAPAGFRSTYATSAQHEEFGINRRVVTVPVAPTYPGEVIDFACMLMLHPMARNPTGQQIYLEFLGRAGDPGVPCSTSGMPGAASGARVPVLVR